MYTSILRKSLICTALVILVLLNFIPIINSSNIKVEKQFEIPNKENNKFSIFTYAEKNEVSHDISEIHLENDLLRMRSYYLDYNKDNNDELWLNIEEAHDAVSDGKIENIKQMLTGSRDDYIPHDPIFIDEDDDFTEENGVTGGNGTVDDPYIIEGWEIGGASDSINIRHTSAYFVIRNCFLKKTVYFYNVTYGAIKDILLDYSGGLGIYVDESSDISVKDSELSCGSCIYVRYSYMVSVINCNLSSTGTGIGINLFYSEFNYLSNLSIKNGGAGIISWVSYNTTIIGCEVFFNNNGIMLIASEYCFLRNNTIYDNVFNFDIAAGFDTCDIDISNTINGKPMYYIKNENNLVFDGNDDIGFFALVNCVNIEVKNFITSGNAVGIILAGTTDSTITSSSFNDGGYLYGGSSNNYIDSCIFNGRGIWIDYSPNNKLRNVDILGGDFSVYGTKIEDYHQDIDLSNTRRDKPIYYIVGENNGVFNNLDCGYLGIVSCKNILVVDIEINENYEGLLLVDSSGTVTLCSFSNNFFGIKVFSSSELTISWCNLKENEDGLSIVQSSDIQVKRCTIDTNYFYGIYFEGSHDNIVTKCSIKNNNYGVILKESWDNKISSNTYILNSGTGIMLSSSWFNEIWNNTFSFCDKGIRLHYDWWDEGSDEYCHDNNIHHNTLNYCGLFGIEIYESNNNSITYNNIKHTVDFGITVVMSNDNFVDHNNFVDNRIGAVVAYCNGDLRNNWWGSASGPGGVGPGSGDIIEVNDGTVLFEPWLTSPASKNLQFYQGKLSSPLLRFLERYPTLKKVLLSLIE